MSIYDSSYSAPKTITFSSSNLTNGSSSQFQSSYTDLGVNNYDSVVLLDASIPKSFYNIPAGYNSFQLTEQGTTVTVTIPARSYNINNFVTTLGTVLTSASTKSWTYTCSYTPASQGDTYYIYFAVSGNSGNQPTITMLTGYQSPFRQLGLEDSTAYTFSGNALNSVNAVNLALVTTCYIISDVCSGAYKSILQQFLGIGSFPPLSIMYFQQQVIDIAVKSFSNLTRFSWNFQLVDDLFLPINTNGIPWAFTLFFFKRAVAHEFQEIDLLIKNEMRMNAIQNARTDLAQQVQQSSQPLGSVPPAPIPPFSGLITPLGIPTEPQIEYPRSQNNIPQIHYPS